MVKGHFDAYLERLTGVDVHQLQSRVDGMPVAASIVTIEQLHLPKVLSHHGNVVVNVAADLLIVRRHGSGNVVTVQRPTRQTMNELYNVAVFDVVSWLVGDQFVTRKYK